MRMELDLGSYFRTIPSTSARVRIVSTGNTSTSTFFKKMVESGIRHCAIVAPDGDPQSPRFNDLNRVIDAITVCLADRFLRRDLQRHYRVHQEAPVHICVCRRGPLFDIAELKLPNQTLENFRPFRGRPTASCRNEREWKELIPTRMVGNSFRTTW